MSRLVATLAAVTTVAALASCAAGRSARPGAHPPEQTDSAGISGWPEDWAIRFAFRCAERGEDVRFCACLASRIQRAWAPDQFRSLGPDGLRDEVRLCRERLGGVEAQ